MAATTELDILARVIEPQRGGLSPDAARHILDLHFAEDDRRRMEELASKAAAGTLTPDEENEAESFNKAGHILALLQSGARQALRKNGQRT